MDVKSGEIIFVKCVKDGIPNRDPLADSDARRIFDDGRISLSDVSMKRDVRDYVLARYPDGGEQKRNFIFVREERTPEGNLLGRGNLVNAILERAGVDKDRDLKTSVDRKQALCKHTFDVRVFGAVYSVKNESFHLTGPVQFGWAHSLHPVETRYVQGTVVMPSKEAGVKKKGEADEEGSAEEGKAQGTIWTTYTLPFAVFVMPGVINGVIASQTEMREADVDLLLEGLWRGTQHRQARGRGNQQPLFLLHVEYKDPFFRIGYLEEGVCLGENVPKSLNEVRLDLRLLGQTLERHRDKIARCRYWTNPALAGTQGQESLLGEAGRLFGE